MNDGKKQPYIGTKTIRVRVRVKYFCLGIFATCFGYHKHGCRWPNFL